MKGTVLTSLLLLVLAIQCRAADQIESPDLVEQAPSSFEKVESEIPLFGHNLTPTTYTVSKNQVTVGNYAVGLGLSDQFMIATSPWMIVDYNMPMLGFKYGNWLTEKIRASAEIFYFKTYPYFKNRYDMEAWMGRFGGSYKFSEKFTLHTNLSYIYFINDAAPFSLRLTPGNDNKYTVSLGTLMEVKVLESFGLLQEFGVLGLNYYNSYFHMGSSLFWKWASGYFQFGLSQSSTIRKVGVDQNGQAVYNSEHVWHPEVQLQLFFK